MILRAVSGKNKDKSKEQGSDDGWRRLFKDSREILMLIKRDTNRDLSRDMRMLAAVKL